MQDILINIANMPLWMCFAISGVTTAIVYAIRRDKFL